MFISLCTKFCQFMLLFHFTTSYLEYGDEERIIDMDDLMKVRYKSPKRLITPYEDLNPKYYNFKDNAANNFPEENHLPITVELVNGPLTDTVHDLTEKNLSQTKDDPTIRKLEDLMLHPIWLTLPKQKLKSKTTETNIKELADIERIRRLQEAVKNNLYNSGRVKKIWGKSDHQSEDIFGENFNNLQNNNNEINNLEYENQLVLKTLNDFYVRLFEAIVQVVPSLRFEDPFLGDSFSRTRSNFNNIANKDAPSSPTDFNRNTLGQYIEKKLEHLKKEPVQNSSLPEIVTWSKLLHNIPNILFMNSSDKDKDDRLFNKLDKASKPINTETNYEKITKFPHNNHDFLQYIPQIKYNYDVDKYATNFINKNTSTTKMWYYSRYYTESPPSTKEAKNSKLTEENDTTQSSIEEQWAPINFNDENGKIYQKNPNLGHLFRHSDMSRRIEWENMGENSNENSETSDTDHTQGLLTTVNDHVDVNLPKQSKWFKHPMKNNLEYYFSDRNLNNKNNLKCDGKLCDLVRNAYELANRKYSLT